MTLFKKQLAVSALLGLFGGCAGSEITKHLSAPALDKDSCAAVSQAATRQPVPTLKVL